MMKSERSAVLPGTLYLIATPIGNLSDISQRAIDILEQVDFILCEDTRHSGILLDHYGIHKRVVSYFAHNEALRTDQFLPDLQGGQSAALITDAGTPGISDPGSRLVDACHEAGITVCPVPGACAAATAVSAGGFYEFTGFEFVAFFPRKSSERQDLFKLFAHCNRLLVGYESPQRIVSLLDDLIAVLGPERRVCLCRELTKKFETITRTTAQRLRDMLTETPCKGELCLVIEGSLAEEADAREITEDAMRLIDLLRARGMSAKDIRDIVSAYTGIQARAIYQYVLSLDKEP